MLDMEFWPIYEAHLKSTAIEVSNAKTDEVLFTRSLQHATNKSSYDDVTKRWMKKLSLDVFSEHP